jgi:hypothetical protein
VDDVGGELQPDATNLQVEGSQLSVPVDDEFIVNDLHVSPFRLSPSHCSPSSSWPFPQVSLPLLAAPSSLPPQAPTTPAAPTERRTNTMGSLAFMLMDPLLERSSVTLRGREPNQSVVLEP